MTDRRLPKSLPSSKLETRDPDAPTPCVDEWHIFDELIDHAGGPAYRGALRVARSLCGFHEDGSPKPAAESCPIRDTCLRRDNADEVWAKAVVRVEERRGCERCGRSFMVPKRGQSKRFCSGACQIAATREVRTLGDIPETVRIMHAAFIRAKARGETVTAQVREGERTYQALRHEVRKAKRKQVAA